MNAARGLERDRPVTVPHLAGMVPVLEENTRCASGKPGEACMATEGMGFGQLIRDRRRQMGMTQEELALQINTSTPYIGHIEAGKRTPSDEILTRLADVLSFDRRELFFLANPNARALFTPKQPAQAHSAWEEFRRDENLHRLHQITAREMHTLSQVALMGEVRSSRDFIYILNTIRQSLVNNI